MLFSSAYSAPMNEPMEVPPTMSTGIPASLSARRMPTWEQPLKHIHLDDFFSFSDIYQYVHKEFYPSPARSDWM